VVFVQNAIGIWSENPSKVPFPGLRPIILRITIRTYHQGHYSYPMDADVPPDWSLAENRAYTPAHSDREMEYRIYAHESGDLRVKVAPASLDGDDHPGYTLTVTSYPGLEFSETIRIRTVLRFERCKRIAMQFMDLFSASYDGPGSLEDALEYAHHRTRDHR